MFGDKIYVINLPNRKDRKIECKKHAKKYGLKLNFVDGINGEELDIKKLVFDGVISKTYYDPHGTGCTKGMYGCGMSHYKAWKKAYDDGVEVALFLEDDFFISPFIDYDFMVKESRDYIMGVNWDILFLGKHKRFVTGEEINPLMVKTTEDWMNRPLKTRDDKDGVEFWGAHAYLVRREAIKYLIDNFLPMKMASDIWLQYITRKSPLNIYTLKETFIYQRSTLIMINMDRKLSIVEIDEMTDSDTFQNQNRKGKFKWLHIPSYSSGLRRGDYMWEFNIMGINDD